MGPKKKENTGKAFEDRVSSLFWPNDEVKEEDARRDQSEEQQEKEED